MKKKTLIAILSITYFSGVSQVNKDKLLQELSDNSCMCIDSISTTNKSSFLINKEVEDCINKQVGAYQIGSKLANIDLTATSQDIILNTDTNSDDYKASYSKLENYLFKNCITLKKKIGSRDFVNKNSLSTNEKALKLYYKGIDKSNDGNHKKAIKYFKKAIKIDSVFAFAWDNLGLSYRKLNDYDKAIECYEKSLTLDPNGVMPLQNIAIAYQYKEEYHKAIKAFESLAEIDNNNPEIYYGIGLIYALKLKESEKGLDYICKAYNIYDQEKSPYKNDAQTIINIIYKSMKENGKEEKFIEILKSNNILMK